MVGNLMKHDEIRRSQISLAYKHIHTAKSHSVLLNELNVYTQSHSVRLLFVFISFIPSTIAYLLSTVFAHQASNIKRQVFGRI